MWEGVGDRTELQHIDPHSIGCNHVSFPFSWAAQLGAQPLWVLVFSTASYLQLIKFPVRWVLVGVTNCTHSTHPRSRLYSDIPRLDAPVIYTGAFPILTARPGWRSIYNKISAVELGSRSVLVLLRYSFLIFSSLFIWWCLLPIFLSTCNFPSFETFW